LSLTGKGAYTIEAQGDALVGVLSKDITVA
jgi:hypothetical protein